MPYKSLWPFYLDFSKKNPGLFLERDRFLEPPITGNLHKTVYTLSLRRNFLNKKYEQEKGYLELLVLVSMIFLHLFYISDNVIVLLRLVWNL